MDQEQYDLIYSFVRDKQFPAHLSKNRKDSLRRKCKRFVIKSDGLLYYRNQKKNVDLQVS